SAVIIVALASHVLAAPPTRLPIALAQRVPATSRGMSDGWKSYQSARDHFSLEHPIGWAAAETVDGLGALVTTFMPPTGVGVTVIVSRGSALEVGPSDLGNVRCHAVTVDGQAARACLDTVSASLFTTVAWKDTIYVIAGNRRRGDQGTYDRIVASFRILP